MRARLHLLISTTFVTASLIFLHQDTILKLRASLVNLVPFAPRIPRVSKLTYPAFLITPSTPIMAQVNATQSKKDHWSAKTYSAAAGFVPKLTKKVLLYLDPKPTDRVLDVGCGDGKFTANFLDNVAEVYGVDSSPSFINSANQDYGGTKAKFKVVDCRVLESDREAMAGQWDKVVSNAALHWILRDPSTRLNTLKACYGALKPGGQFAFEMGGAGNVAEVHAALIGALLHRNFTMAEAQEASPWFFPSEAWMKPALESIGFQVEKLELEYRPTKLTTDENGGLDGWVRLMGGSMLDLLTNAQEREDAVQEICGVLKNICGREDGSQYLGYVRLRGLARKPFSGTETK